jgi:GT2 family glycosyltransferase
MSTNGKVPLQEILSDRPSTITVVVPNYNHDKYLAQSLASILEQSRKPDRVIIVDDASTDGSCTTIERFTQANTNWKFIKNSINRGVIFALNGALSEADTDWITFLGADDVLDSEYVKEVMSLAEEFPTVGLVCACAERFGPSIAPALRPIVLPRKTRGLVSAGEFRYLLKNADNFFLGTVTTYRCKAMRDLGGFDQYLGAFTDAMLARQLAARYGFAFVPQILGFWRIHGENYSTTTSMNAKAVDARLARAHVILAAETEGLFPKGYADIFDRRQRFGGARLVALTHNMSAELRADAIQSLLKLGALEGFWLKTLLVVPRIGAIAAVAWLIARFRPMSLMFYLAQRHTRRSIASNYLRRRPK